MRRVIVIGFLLLIGMDTMAQLSFKMASDYALPLALDLEWFERLFTRPWVYGAILGYLGAFVTWMTVLKYAPVGPSFAASHLEVVSVTFFSVWLLGEQLNMYKVAGGILILLGVLCLARSEETDAGSGPEA